MFLHRIVQTHPPRPDATALVDYIAQTHEELQERMDAWRNICALLNAPFASGDCGTNRRRTQRGLRSEV